MDWQLHLYELARVRTRATLQQSMMYQRARFSAMAIVGEIRPYKANGTIIKVYAHVSDLLRKDEVPTSV